ncbi:hypothetical protein [Staphylococcus epidermidis]|uniref:hypothetical protein n=1 Tax=Staphylococcus epidermidis TaxID=1282 RepID=UPI00124ED0F4|nr:hypothetical protein [Staphylococcus epidermidis]KAB2304609.1 hypothetical protein F9B78_01080 [Staphylococcus epidermidis]
MSKNIERYTIWEIENESMNLDIILELLKKDYKQEIKYLQKHELSDIEKTLNNKWINPDAKDEILIKEYDAKLNFKNDDLKNIKYISMRKVCLKHT